MNVSKGFVGKAICYMNAGHTYVKLSKDKFNKKSLLKPLKEQQKELREKENE